MRIALLLLTFTAALLTAPQPSRCQFEPCSPLICVYSSTCAGPGCACVRTLTEPTGVCRSVQ